MSEELYLEYEMKYRDRMMREVEKAVRAYDCELALKIHAAGYSYDFLVCTLKVSCEGLKAA